MGRGREGPQEFLRDFRGTLQSDGYGAYAKLGEGIVYAGCLKHARRGFVETAKVAPLDPLPTEILARFGQLYAIEKEAREAGLDADQRLALRRQKSVPLMTALQERLVAMQQFAAGGYHARYFAHDLTLRKPSADPEVILNSFIIANTRFEQVDHWLTPGTGQRMSKADFEKRNVLFQNEDKATYIGKMLNSPSKKLL
jgi:hypothetical protein